MREKQGGILLINSRAIGSQFSALIGATVNPAPTGAPGPVPPMKDTPDTGSSFEIQRLVGRYAVPTDPYTQLSLTDPCRTEHGARRWREIEEWQRAPVG